MHTAWQGGRLGSCRRGWGAGSGVCTLPVLASDSPSACSAEARQVQPTAVLLKVLLGFDHLFTSLPSSHDYYIIVNNFLSLLSY